MGVVSALTRILSYPSNRPAARHSIQHCQLVQHLRHLHCSQLDRLAILPHFRWTQHHLLRPLVLLWSGNTWPHFGRDGQGLRREVAAAGCLAKGYNG